MRKVSLRAAVSDQHLSRTCLWFNEYEQVACAIPFVFIVLPDRLSRLQSKWSCNVSQQLNTFFIKTDHRTPGIIGFLVQLQNMLHLANELGSDFRNTPASYLPGFEFVFFSSSRTVSGERCVTMPSFNTSCVNNSNVQRAWPAGGSLQAN